MTQMAPLELPETYERRFAAVSQYRERVWAVLTREFFQRFIPDQAVVLDVGCGWGEFVNQIRARQKFGMDLNPSSARHLHHTVTFLHQSCSDPWPLPDGSLDVVFTSNFLEHLPDKAALRETVVFRCVKPGGKIICLGPNIKHLPGAYWDFWDHFVPLTELSLKECLELAGFRVERCVDRFLPYTMATGFTPAVWTVSMYLRLPFLWRWLGKQFLVVAVKP